MNLKKLLEEKANKQKRMTEMLNNVEKEERALSEDEQKEFDELEKSINSISETVERVKKARELTEEEDTTDEGDGKSSEDNTEKKEEAETRAFANYIRTANLTNVRADVNMSMGDNGAVVPQSIAKKIIEKVVDMCPIFQLADRYNVKGTLTIPYYDEETQSIECDYADEFSDAEGTSGKFASILLTGFLARALTKVSKSLINNSDFDLVNFVVKKMGEAIARFIEKQLLYGKTGKITGLDTGVKQKITAAATTAVTADELIDVQEEVPDVYQGKAIWIMNKDTRKAIRKLKDSDGNYLLNRDVTAKWGYTLLGKDVYTSASMEKMVAGKTAIFYGDMEGLAVNIQEDINIQVLLEKYAEQHVVGVLGFVQLDAKVEDGQKISKLTMKASA